MKKIFYFLVFTIGTSAFGQQLPQFTQYMFNQYAFNPAYAGVHDYWQAMSNNRYQWLGITDAPRTFTLSTYGKLRNEKLAMGGYLYTDITGPTRRIGFQTSFAYHLRLTEGIQLSFGLSGGFNQWILDADKVTTYHEDDFYFSNGLLSTIDPDAKFGLYLYHDDWYFGASIEQLFHNNISFLATQTNSDSFMEDHYYFTAGYNLALGEDWEIQPSALLKLGLPAPPKFDVNLRVTYQDFIWVGAGLRTADAITTMIGFKYNDMLTIGYAYDITTTEWKTYNTGTHELLLGVNFGKSKAKAEQ